MLKERISPSSIKRLKDIKVCNFRGMIGEHCLNVDADLVLIDGPNGQSKTSLLEAIGLALTGHYYSKSKYFIHEYESFTDLRSLNKNTGYITLNTNCGKIHLDLQGRVRRSEDLHPSHFYNEGRYSEEVCNELEIRMIGFFQEHLYQQFENTATGKTLQAFYNEIPQDIQGLRDKWIPSTLEKLKQEARHSRYRDPEDFNYEKEGFLQKLDNFSTYYNRLRNEHFPGWPAMGRPRSLKDLEGFSLNWTVQLGFDNKNDPDSFYNILLSFIDEKEKEYKKNAVQATEATHGLLEKRHSVERRIQTLNEQWPHLDRELDAFSHPELGRGAACKVLEVLADSAEKWSQARVKTRDAEGDVTNTDALERVQEEFARVTPDMAAQLSKAIWDWQQPRIAAWEKVNQLKKELEDIDHQLQESRISESLRSLNHFKIQFHELRNDFTLAWSKALDHQVQLRQKHVRKEARQKLIDLVTTLETVQDHIKAITEPTVEILEPLQRLLTDILFRFSTSNDFLPLTLKQNEKFHLNPQSSNDLPLWNFSTGQKCQTAVALMIAQNLVVGSNKLPAILLFDDVTTSYDMNNLTREALLWRQLAYSGTDELKRQVFISSHHEDLTSNLIELLTPPQERKMHILRFSDWNNTTGPTIEQFDVVPTGGFQDKGRLKQLEEALCQRN